MIERVGEESAKDTWYNTDIGLCVWIEKACYNNGKSGRIVVI